MSIAVSSFASRWAPRDDRSRTEWCKKYVWEPNMARGSRFDPMATPYFVEPLDFSADNRVKEMIVRCPTGAGKSTLVTCMASHTVAERDGDLLLAVQGNAEAQKYVNKRLVPCFRQIPVIRAMIEAMDRFAVKKGSISLPDRTVYWGGANETNAQATSATLVVVDEAWMAEHGLLEQFRARLHSRWNGRFVALGQGGMEKIDIDGKLVDTEWHASWLRTDQREWCFECPQCKEVQRYRLKGLIYDRGSNEAGEIDEAAITQSVRYQCIGASREKQTCDAEFLDTSNQRRALSKTGRYVVQHEKHRANHHGWHVNALGVWYESWAGSAIAHAHAHRSRKNGDIEPIKIFRQKRMAENYREEEALPQTALTFGTTGERGEERPYKFEDYAHGEEWPGEACRIMSIDVQKDHYWVCIRAFKADGSSRRLLAEKVLSIATVRDIQIRYRVPPLTRTGTQAPRVFIDSSYDSDAVYKLCAEYGWIAVQGEKKPSFPHTWNGSTVYKYYSPARDVRASNGATCRLIFLASTPLKRILERLRGGYRAQAWEVNSDIGPELTEHLFSEVERNGIYVAIKPNHTWDLEYYIIAGAIIAGVLADAPEPEKTDGVSAPVSIDTADRADVRA